MALAAKLEDTPKRSTGKPCSVGAVEDLINSEGGPEAEAFQAMLHKLGWSGRRVWDAIMAEAKELRAAGEFDRAAVYAAMSEQQVNRHRGAGCRCFK